MYDGIVQPIVCGCGCSAFGVSSDFCVLHVRTCHNMYEHVTCTSMSQDSSPSLVALAHDNESMFLNVGFEK